MGRRKLLLAVLAGVAAGTLWAKSDAGPASFARPAPRDPATVWDRKELYRAPKTWGNQDPFRGEVSPMWIEGVPYRGKPTRAFAFFGIPPHASPTNKVPGIVLVHGGLGTAYPEWVRLWVRRGYAAIAVDNCGQLPALGLDGKWIANPDGGPRGWGRIDCVDEPLADQWPYHAVAVNIRAHSYLRALPSVDASRIGTTGISWGGFLLGALVAADDRFAYAMPVYGCGFNYERGGITWSQKGVEKWSALWDPVVYLPYAKCPFLWLDGTNDFAFTLDRVRRSAALAPAEHAFSTILRMPHGHGKAGEAPAELRAFADHYAFGRPDVVRFSDIAEKDGRVTASFRAEGRRIVRAELLHTCDGADVEPRKRLWKALPLADFDPASGRVSAVLPEGVFAYCVNLVDADGVVHSTPYAER